MIHVKVLGAEHIPIEQKEGWKSIIYCFSFSSCQYFYRSFKTVKNTTSPKWEGEFSADLFRVSQLYFFIYNIHIAGHKIFIGKVYISIPDLLERSGSQIISSPSSFFSMVFPIESCKSSNASLFLSFSYSPKIYNPIQISKITKPIIHMWTTFSPPNKTKNVEIELIQAYTIKNAKNEIQFGMFYDFNSKTSWEPVGYSSNTNNILVSNGITQIRSLLPHRILDKYEFFIINNINYTGKVTLNFIAEQRDKKKKFKNRFYYEAKKDNQTGVIHTIDVICEPNTKYCVPLFLFCDKKRGHKDFQFKNFTLFKYEKLEDPDRNNAGEIQFNREIIEKAKEYIPEWNNVNFIRTNCLPFSQSISLTKVFNDLNLQNNTHLRIYTGGLTKTTYTDTSFVDYWTPEFLVYDKTNDTRCPEIPKGLKTIPNMIIADKKDPIFGYDWHSYVNLDLDQIGREKAIVFIIYCPEEMETANPDGFFLISQVDQNSETLLFRCPIFPEGNQTHFEVFFRFEYIDNEWQLIPMKYYFKKSKKLKMFLDTLYINNWNLSDRMADRIQTPNFDSSS